MKSIYEFLLDEHLLGEHLLNEHLLKSKTVSSMQDIDCVDLGLPSGLLWAKCNIGAKTPTDYGDYFMWGSTEPNTNDECAWGNAPFNDGRANYSGSYFKTIENKVCKNGNLIPEYDAAAVILGDEWRMPTKTDFRELMDNTKHEWIKNYNNSGVNGMLFTSKINNAELFIPAAGYRNKLNIEAKNAIGAMWCSSLNVNIHYYAWGICFGAYYCDLCYTNNTNTRSGGLSIRAVKES